MSQAGSSSEGEGPAGTPAPRRSGRARKSLTQDIAPKKGKSAGGAESDGSEMLVMDDDGDEEDEEELPSDASSGEEFAAPTKAKKGKKQPRKSTDSTASARPKARPSTDKPSTAPKRKRPATSKKTGASSGAEDAGSGTDGEGKSKKAKTAGAMGRKGGRSVEQAAIEKDNIFFNALFTNAALGPIIEEWAEKYEDEEDDALWELVVFFIRSAGSSAAVEKDKAVDLDGVPSFVDDLEKEESLGSYPLISRDKTFRGFQSSLSSFLHTFIHHVSLSDTLYCSSTARSEPSALMNTLQSWLFTLSHSPLRSFRHTGTVIALDVMTGLTEALKEVNEELSVVSRQKESEKKKARSNTKEGKEGLKELDKKTKHVHWKKSRLEEYLKEFFNTVFVMRYRDLDERIRTECVKHLGLWMRTLPDVYLESAYFKYLGWMLDDINSPTRLETVRALVSLYSNESHLVALSTFTERFKGRLLEIAFHDTDLNVRTTAIQVLGHIDRAGMLDDEKRSQIGLLVFEVEPRIRKAVAGFFEGLWNDEIQEALEGLDVGSKRKSKKKKDDSDEEDVADALKKRLGWKSLAALLVRFSTALEGHAEAGTDDQPELVKALDQAVKMKMGAPPKDRITAAVESLWEKVDGLRGWEDLIEFLGMDHSRKEDEGDVMEDDDARAEQAWKLSSEEEACLAHVLLASLEKAKEEADKADEESSASADLTRALIRHFPRLLSRYQGEATILADILAIPRLMSIETYLDLRMVAAFDSLWDDLSKTYLRNSEYFVLNSTLLTIRHLLECEALSNSSSIKINELEESLMGGLREIIGGRDIPTAVFEEDEVPTLEAACRRIGLLLAFRPAVAAIEETEGDSPSGWTLLLDLASRGSLGYNEEGPIVDECLETLTRFVFHRAKTADSQEAQFSLLEKRSALGELLEEYTVGKHSNATESVRRLSFRLLLSLHIFFNPLRVDDSTRKEAQSRNVPAPLHLTLNDEVQWRCAGFVQAEIDKYSEELLEAAESLDLDENDSDNAEENASELGDEENSTPKPVKKSSKSPAKQRAKMNERDVSELSDEALQSRWRFNCLISTFIQSLVSEVLDLEHAAVVLTHFGRFGFEYDEMCKRLAEYMKSAACYGSSGPVASRVVVKSLQDAFELFMDGDVEEDHLMGLAKILSHILVFTGPQFKILAKIDSNSFTTMHKTLVEWITTTIGQHQTKGNKPKLKKSLVFFKALVPLLAGAVGQDALVIHAHMAEALEKASVTVSKEKLWDYQRAFDKRLTTLMSKDSRIAKGARKQVADADVSPSPPASPTGAKAPRGRKRARTSADGGDGDDDEGASKAKKPRPKPKTKTRKSKATVDESGEEEGESDAVEEEDESPEEEMLDMGESSPVKAPSEPQPPSSSPMSSHDESLSQTSVVVSKRKSMPKT